MTRLEKAKIARHLRDDEGLRWVDVGARMGLARSTAFDIYNDPTGDKARARKAKAAGACVDCGAPTAYDVGRPYERCEPCGRAQQARDSRARRNTRALEMIELRRQGLLNHEIAARLGCSPRAVAGLLCRAARDGLDVPRSPYWSRYQEEAA